MQKELFRSEKLLCVGKTLNLDICSKFWGNCEGFGEILGKSRIWDGRSMGSKGFKQIEIDEKNTVL